MSCSASLTCPRCAARSSIHRPRLPRPASPRRRRPPSFPVQVTVVFARRAYNVQSLAVGPAEVPGDSRITTVVPGTTAGIRTLIKNIKVRGGGVGAVCVAGFGWDWEVLAGACECQQGFVPPIIAWVKVYQPWQRLLVAGRCWQAHAPRPPPPHTTTVFPLTFCPSAQSSSTSKSASALQGRSGRRPGPTPHPSLPLSLAPHPCPSAEAGQRQGLRRHHRAPLRRARAHARQGVGKGHGRWRA